MKSSRTNKAGVLQGALILLVLRTLEALGPLHGYGIARRIEQISNDVLQLNQGTLYFTRLCCAWSRKYGSPPSGGLGEES